jgi:guanylate kinase
MRVQLDILEQRLKGRGTETEDSLKKRLATVGEDLAYAKQGLYLHLDLHTYETTVFDCSNGCLQTTD